jgi:hypothetical protein
VKLCYQALRSVKNSTVPIVFLAERRPASAAFVYGLDVWDAD